jgi:hypothetical protein
MQSLAHEQETLEYDCGGWFCFGKTIKRMDWSFV